MKKQIYFILILSFGLHSCYDDSNGIIKEGIRIHKNYNSELEELLPLFDSTYFDSCNVFFINMSPTTELFVQEGTIDHLYDSSKFEIMTKEQEAIIHKRKPRLELTGTTFLKNVFLAFTINKANHYSLDHSYLVRVIDENKFKRVYFNLKDYKTLKGDKSKITNWYYPINKEWIICTGNIIHSGDSSICHFLNSK
ncbi:MAG: hypothetical protein V4638_09280 [Bacteroidota bacterium]